MHPHGPANPDFAGIISRQGQIPVAELIVKSLQVTGCRPRGFLKVPTFIHPPVLPKTVKARRGRDKLPGTDGVPPGIGPGIQPAFHHRVIDQLLGDPFLLQDRPHDLEVPGQPVQPSLHAATALGAEKLDDPPHLVVVDDGQVPLPVVIHRGDVTQIGRQ